MKNALMGLITGFAQGTSDRITEERLEEKTLLANRFKLAAANKKQRDVEDKEKTAIAQRRNDQINTFFGSASVGQKLALLSNETMFNLAIENKDNLAGPSNQSKLDEFIVLKADEIPKNFKFATDYATSVKSMPAKMPDMQSREVFFSKVTPDQRQMDGMAAAFGTPSAAELLSYENMPDAVADPVFGSVNLDAIKAPKSIEDRIEGLRNSLPDATPEEAAAIKENIDKLIVHQNVGLSPKTLTADADRIAMLLKNATGQEEVALKAELAKVNGLIRSNGAAQAQEKDRATAFGGTPRTFNETLKLVEMAQVSALSKSFGLNALKEGKMIEIITEADGSTRERSRSPRAGDAKEFTTVSDKAAIDYLTQMGHIKPDGSMSDFAKNIMVAKGINLGAQPTPTEEKVNPAAPAAPAPKTVTMAQVAQIAKNNNLSVDAVKADMVSKGFIIK